ncbi:ATP-grasp domain-containing protein [Fusobacterium mortiferum]|uniref:ATP-grasp domain-containing protein n=1 Tax=Fusobacterium mortiferum TaxID=850 RepID=UPI001F2CF2E5|nr:ATP-grasp domain-containing protein [Fusobacterium mortiferum]MCF2699469.1 ATP-grasp domain-containing protein [Fusobacterium mortiferum]MCI7666867.1 ATP-grasp domain-containing protein [Fusobacterium mortiferum]
MNILILSVGTRNKIVQYFKKETANKGKIIVTDMSILAPAIYEADKYYIVPKITDLNYIDKILDICKKEKIDGVLSLIDPELSLLAENENKFKEIGVKIVGSSYELCEMALDKIQMYNFCKKNEFKTARSWNNLEEFKNSLAEKEVTFPVFVKPQRGSASIAISKVYDIETIELLFLHARDTEKLMIQEFLDGQEIGVDVYIDLISGEVVSIFSKKKIVMRAGETDKAVSFKDEKLFELIKNFVKKSGYKGQIDIDIFEIEGEYYISEVNPRFGGGYPHAYECGINNMKFILNNLSGEANESVIGKYEENIYMMKYNEVCIKKSKF